MIEVRVRGHMVRVILVHGLELPARHLRVIIVLKDMVIVQHLTTEYNVILILSVQEVIIIPDMHVMQDHVILQLEDMNAILLQHIVQQEVDVREHGMLIKELILVLHHNVAAMMEEVIVGIPILDH